MPISMIECNTPYVITRLTGKDDIKHHLERLGCTVGESVRVISKINGNVIIAVKGTRLALDESLARHIMV